MEGQTVTPNNGDFEARLHALETRRFPLTDYGQRKENVRLDAVRNHRHPRTGAILLKKVDPGAHPDPEAVQRIQEFESDAVQVAERLVNDPHSWRYATPEEIELWEADQARRVEQSEALARQNGGHTVMASPAAVVKHLQAKEK
jgi:hypothetical protein